MKKLLLLFLLLTLTGCGRQADLGASSDVSATALKSKFDNSDIKSKYQLDGTSLKMIAKDDPKDMVKVTVGNDSELLGAESEFEPSVKISRWDEVSMKITPKGLDKIASKDKKVKLENGKVKFQTPKQDFELYDLPVSEDLPEGGYEFEWILKEKPTTNVVEFDIETEGLEFYYQAPLKNENPDGSTWEEVDGDSSTRPVNINGSYAVYYENGKSGDYSATVGKKNYKSGKVGHIYRPKIIDANGNWVWGEFNQDLQDTKKLTVTVPQDWLDKAVYPVVVDPTLGYTSVPSTSTSWTIDTIRGWEYTNTSAGNVYNIVTYCASTSGTSYWRGVIYNEGTTGSLVTYGSEVSSSSSTHVWRVLPLTKVALSASTTYKIGWWIDGGTMSAPYDSGLTQHRYTYTYHSTNAAPDPWSESSSTADRKVGIYAAYSTISGTTETFDVAGTYTWVAPTGATSVDVACWGGGGAGGSASGEGGGGGGAYAASTGIAVTAGNSYTVVVGAGAVSSDGNGEDSSFNGTTVVADGGSGGTASGGSGGTVANSTGNVRYAGGNGGNDYGTKGGGGGGAGGPHGAGNNGANGNDSTGGTGGSGDAGYGGAGGIGGGNNGSPGENNVLGGGGGGGDGSTFNGGKGGSPGGGGGGEGSTGFVYGDGADGACTITYTIGGSSSSGGSSQNLIIFD